MACTMSAELEELDDASILETFLVQNAGLIYQKAKHATRLGENESIYIVTACIKSDGYGLAAYQDAKAREILRLSKRFPGDSSDNSDRGRIYDWVDRGTGEARLWPNTIKEASLREGKCHSLFLRGFKLAFSTAFRARMRGVKNPSSNGKDATRRSEGADRSTGNNGSPTDQSRRRPGGSNPETGSSRNGSSASGGSSSLTGAVHVYPFPTLTTVSSPFSNQASMAPVDTSPSSEPFIPAI